MEVPINWLAVIAAAVSNMVLGFAWYSDALFGKQWRKLSGMTFEGKPTQNQMVKMIVLGFGIAFVMAYVLNHSTVFASSYLGVNGVPAGLMSGFWNWLGFVFPMLLSAYIYEKKPLQYVFINSGFWLTSMLVMGVIISVWR
ncbi:DUF1761 domain-containing protein [Candidatus Daviesbacteria bacterium]|nr:DUF1761 domain-containing protein [Candidatus Daviesbacteria bacterium]